MTAAAGVGGASTFERNKARRPAGQRKRRQYRIWSPWTIVKRTLLTLMSLQSHLSAKVGRILLGWERLLLAGVQQRLEAVSVESSARLFRAVFRRVFRRQWRGMAPAEAGVRGRRGQMGRAEGILRLGQVERGRVGKRRIGLGWDGFWRGERNGNLGNGRRKDIHGRRK